ncbi:putative protease [Changjiang astro-like virus]|uniref:putative protease n=1 Tax=Changjiang astro-like virus TaxID=1922764 RepID=UPI00090ABAA0|nr:putative protease [Changjiang astro-like virus]APG79035.1 putative protease [Changjiang astro-like virus]
MAVCSIFADLERYLNHKYTRKFECLSTPSLYLPIIIYTYRMLKRLVAGYSCFHGKSGHVGQCLADALMMEVSGTTDGTLWCMIYVCACIFALSGLTHLPFMVLGLSKYFLSGDCVWFDVAMVPHIWKVQLPGFWVLWSILAYTQTQLDWTWLVCATALIDIIVIIVKTRHDAYTRNLMLMQQLVLLLMVSSVMLKVTIPPGMILVIGACLDMALRRRLKMNPTVRELLYSNGLHMKATLITSYVWLLSVIWRIVTGVEHYYNEYASSGITGHTRPSSNKSDYTQTLDFGGVSTSDVIDRFCLVRSMNGSEVIHGPSKIVYEGATINGHKPVKLDIRDAIVGVYIDGEYVATGYRSGSNIIVPLHVWTINGLDPNGSAVVQVKWHGLTEQVEVVNVTQLEDGDGWVYLNVPKKWSGLKSIKPHGSPTTIKKGYLWLVRDDQPTLVAVKLGWMPGIIAHDGSTIPGDSGAPITDEHGNILAIHNGYLRDSQVNAALAPPQVVVGGGVQDELVNLRATNRRNEEKMTEMFEQMRQLKLLCEKHGIMGEVEQEARGARKRMVNHQRKPLRIWSDQEYEKLLDDGFTRDELKAIATKRRKEYDYYEDVEPEGYAKVQVNSRDDKVDNMKSSCVSETTTEKHDQKLAKAITKFEQAVDGLKTDVIDETYPDKQVEVAIDLHTGLDHKHVSVTKTLGDAGKQDLREALATIQNFMVQWSAGANQPREEIELETRRVKEHCPLYQMGWGECDGKCGKIHRHYKTIPPFGKGGKKLITPQNPSGRDAAC